jgi:hypothetical protein
MQRRSFVTLVASAGLWAEAPVLLAAETRTVVVLTMDGERDLCAGCRGKLVARGFLRAGARSPWA